PLLSLGFVGVLLWLALGFSLMGMTFGPMGALLPELFPTNVRYTGSGISYNVSSILGAAVAPFVAVWLWQTGNGSPVRVGVYLAVSDDISLRALIIGKESRDLASTRSEPDGGEASSPSPLLPGVSQTLDAQLAEGGGHI